MKKYIFLFLVFLLQKSFALFEYKEIFADASGVCSAFSCENKSPSVVYYNPAGIFNIPKYSFYFSNTNLYGLSQLANNTLCFASEIKSLGKVSLLYNIFGFELYKESLVYFTYANSIKEKFSFGVNIKSLSVDIKNYGSKSFLSFDVGVLARPHYKVLTSCVVKDITSTQIAEDEIIQKELVVGSKIQLVKNIFSSVDIIKNPKDSVFFRLGEEIRYELNDKFLSILRFGVETTTEYKPARYALGLGLVYKLKDNEFIFDYSYLNHNILGGQHLVSLGINFGTKQEVYYEEEPTKKIKTTKTKKDGSLQKPKITKEKLPQKPINLNTAQAEEIAQLPGIGPSTAQKIVEYRQQIGKFTSLEQLLEVPRVGSLTLQRIKSFVVLDETKTEQQEKTIEKKPVIEGEIEPEKLVQQKKLPTEITEEKKDTLKPELIDSQQQVVIKKETEEKKYNLNTITEEELKSLGFSSYEAKNIIRYRTRFGRFKSIEELYKVPNLNRKNIDKIKNLLYVE